mmetsp:Transcript_123758/g.196243  ORF Transcript_123758/g.196243 Transcript_123758/m.196243 type:complete len:84 (+) Transcript_123758:157-408(+)
MFKQELKHNGVKTNVARFIAQKVALLTASQLLPLMTQLMDSTSPVWVEASRPLSVETAPLRPLVRIGFAQARGVARISEQVSV